MAADRPAGARLGVAARGKPNRPNQHYLPTLFDRLRDDAPSQDSETPDAYVASKSQYRQLVQRDLALLLNTSNHSHLIDAARYPHAARSTLNYGVPALAGSYPGERRWADIEKILTQAIIHYEPRIDPATLVIRPLFKDGAHNHYNVLLFELNGQLLASAYPLEFTLQSTVDLETHHVEFQSA